MRTIGFIALVASILAMPTIIADPAAQTGSQTGMYWSEATAVAVQGGTGFALLGAIGDHDVMFLNGNGQIVGFYLACGPELGGTVPASAVVGLILVWDHDSIPGTCIAAGAAPSSQWVYVDGL